jgi:uncharacterized protein YbaP (TraB family)
MKKVLLAGLLAFASPAYSQAPTAPAVPAAAAPAAAAPAAPSLPDADPALWLVRDADTTIYLFGTFHLLDGRPWFNDEVKTAFDASNELVLEAIIPENPAELQPMIVRYAVDQQGRRLSQRLSAEQNAALSRALGMIGIPATVFDSLEPWFASMTLATVAGQRLGISPANGPEAVLARAARERNLTVSELEGLEWQIRLFDGMPEEQQLAQLREALDNLDTLAEKLAPMLAAWSSGDVEGLRRIVDQQGEADTALHRLLFTDRNATWAGWIQQRLARPGAVFMAVGAGHLAGADSVQTQLQARGIRAERVPHLDSTPAS